MTASDIIAALEAWCQINMHLCRFLQFAHQQLQAAHSLTQQKAARHIKELEERKTGPKKERELLLKQIEADRASRKDK